MNNLQKKVWGNKMCNILVHGQIFVDELEDFKDVPNIFEKALKLWANKTINEFRKKVTNLFNNANKIGENEVLKLYDINFKLFSQINSLDLDEKLIMIEKFNEIKKIILNENTFFST